MQRQLEALLDETLRISRARRRKLGPNAMAELGAVQVEAREALASADPRRMELALAGLDAAARNHRLSRLRKSLLRSYLEVVIAAAAAALLVRYSVAETYRIPSGSMLPTLHPGDVILVNKLAYGWRLPWIDRVGEVAMPSRGEVIVFRDASGHDLIKRVAGLAGDEVELVDEEVFVNGESQPRELALERFEYWNYRDDLQYWHPQSGALYLETLGGIRHGTIHSRMLPSPRAKEGPFQVPPGHVFVLGDNRDDSDDGRSGGGWYVPVGDVRGRAALVVFSWGREGIWPWGDEGPVLDRILRRVDALSP